MGARKDTASAGADQFAALCDGAVEIYTKDDLKEKISQNRPLRIKMGMDPTAPDIHIGHAVPLRKLRQFQDFGHKAVLIIGDYTARVGDPSGQDRTRPILSEDEIKRNAETYFEQAGKILDTSEQKLEIRYNSEWLSELSFAEVLRLAGRMTVAQMLERDTFAVRHKAGNPIGIHEFLYPLMQGHDSVVIEADVELGATDQTFNCLVGRELQRDAGQEPQVVLVMPMLVGLDGKMKMSKSKGNYVGVADAPGEMYGKLMSITDDMMPNYYELCTSIPQDEVRTLLQELHPKEAKVRLAKAVVTRYHDKKAAEKAAAEFERVFAERQMPAEMPLVRVEGAELADGRLGLARLIVLCGFAPSNSAAMTLIKQGAVRINDLALDDPRAEVAISGKMILKVGKRRFARIEAAATQGPARTLRE